MPKSFSQKTFVVNEFNNIADLADWKTSGGKWQIVNNVLQQTNSSVFSAFLKDYKLRSLGEVESYIKENGHLPDVPPATVTEKGVNLGEFNEKLLQKIEELTLYIIEQDKRIKELEESVTASK